MVNTIDAKPVRPLNPYDPDLPLLASQAAIELERLRIGKPIGLCAVHRLSKRLAASFKKSNEGSPKHNPDPSTVSLLSLTLNESKFQTPTNLEELVSEASNIANNLQTSQPTTSSMQIERTRDFCSALARCSTSFRRSMQLARPQSKFRR